MYPLCLFLLATSLAPAAQEEATEEASDERRVLVVANTNSPVSIEVADYYVEKRDIPEANLVTIRTSTSEQVERETYEQEIETPIRNAIERRGGIDFIVLTKGVPIRVGSGGPSVDAELVAMNQDVEYITGLDEDLIREAISPYFAATERFSSEKFNMYLVTRLDGYTAEDAKALVDNSLAAKPYRGPFLFDDAGNRQSEGYRQMGDSLRMAHEMLQQKGFESSLDTDAEFAEPTGPLMGYAGWGSNDGKFDKQVYQDIEFLPGSLAETFVSTSARTFRPVTGGQSVITDLIDSGVTGVAGYVSEPYTFALVRPHFLFDRYTAGFNLAESFYSAKLVLRWKGLVIGDPLCAPYARP